MSEEMKTVIEKVEKVWSSLIGRFDGRPLDFNFKETVLAILGNENSIASLHSIHPYPAKMFAFIPRFFFSLSEVCPSGGTVIDPFCGSGTVLLESITNPLYKRDIHGVEINPLGRLISKVKVTPLCEERLIRKTIQLLDSLKRLESYGKDTCIQDFQTLSFWFSKKAIDKLSKLKCLIEEEVEEDCLRDFFWVCFSSIVRQVSYADPFIPPPVRLRLEKYENSVKRRLLKQFMKQIHDPDVARLFGDKVRENLERIRQLWKIKEVRTGEVKASIIWDDAREIRVGRAVERGRLLRSCSTKLSSKSVDFILTSPPYLTAQKYIRTSKLELLWLGFPLDEIKRLDRESIGSEKVSRSEFSRDSRLGIKSVDELLSWARERNADRAMMLLKYFVGMQEAISEMYRILKDESYVAMVIGNNRVLGRSVPTYKFLVDIAEDLGFSLKLILRDKIRGRGMITKRHDSGGLIEEEFITVMKKR